MITIALIISVVLNLVLLYGSYNAVRKIERYERNIVWFYRNATNILETARLLDEKEMFEKDDDVGILFDQLIDIIGELRTLLYGQESEEEEEG